MRMRFLSSAACIALALLDTPVEAKNWVSDGGGYWIDRDSRRRDGDLVYFDQVWTQQGYTPGDATRGVTFAYNCGTRVLYGVQDGKLVPPGLSSVASEVSSDTAARWNSLLCS